MSLAEYADMINSRTFISTNYPELDRLIGGGIPVNCITEVFGLPAVGKSRFVKDICIKNHALYIDTENSLPADEYNFLTSNNVDVISENTIETIWGIVNDAIDITDNPYKLIVIDSLAATVTTSEIAQDTDINMSSMLSQAKALTVWLKTLLNKLNGSNVAVVFVNHKKIKPGPIPAVTTPGGAAVKFYSSLRLDFSANKSDLNAKNETLSVTVKLAKTRFSTPNTSCKIKMKLNYKDNYDSQSTIYNPEDSDD